MAGKLSKAVAKARKSLDKVVQKQQRRHALAKATPALKVAGAAAAIVSVIAGAAYAARATAKSRMASKQLATKKKRAVATAATAVGATAIAARVRRGKRG